MSGFLECPITALSHCYTIERGSGSRGMATVYLAADVNHHRKVAVKILRPAPIMAFGTDRFYREIAVTGPGNAIWHLGGHAVTGIGAFQ